MMLLDRYLGKAVVLGTLLALLLLVSIHTLIDFVGDVQDVGEHGFTLLQVTISTLLTVPRRIYEVFPTAVLLGSLLSLGNMAAHNELMVMRAAGVSIWQIIRSAMKAGLLLVVIVLLLGEYVVPRSERRIENMRHLTDYGTITTDSRYGLWAKDGDRFVDIQVVYPDMRFEYVWVYRLDAHQRLMEATFARRANYEDGRWTLKGVKRSIISPQGVVTERHEQERWERLFPPELFEIIKIEPHKLSARRLLKYIEYLKHNDLDASTYESALWTRLSVPLSGAMMLLLTVPFVFGPMRSGGAGQRLFIGLVIGIVFYLINKMINNMGLVYGLPPLLGAALPLIILLVAGLVALRWAR
jgi:lipopolysaccharide export system permease protein